MLVLLLSKASKALIESINEVSESD